MMSLWNLLRFFLCSNTRLKLKDFTLIRADNPHNCKRGGMSIYLKEYLAFCPVSSLNSIWMSCRN